MSGFRWTRQQVETALGRPVRGPHAVDFFSAVGTDTREMEPGSLFVALQGERFDAHRFLGQALDAGASGAVVARIPDDAPGGLAFVEVDDTLRALGALARHRRRQLQARVIGITGTVGKTTTKDLLRTVLAPGFRVHATAGNLNNRVGLPLTLLRAPDEAEALVLEMGTNTPGEIATLAEIAEPDTAVITAVAEGHLEGLGSVEGVMEEKTSLLTKVPPGEVAFVADEPAMLAKRARALLGPERVIVAGLSDAATLRPDGGVQVLDDGTTRWRWRGQDVHLPLRGRHNVRNALLALGVAERSGVAPDDAVPALADFSAPSLRGEWRSAGGFRVIADCYNANPASVAAAVELLASLPARTGKVAVLGTMRELGQQEAALHRRVAEAVARRVGGGIDLVVATGAFSEAFGGVGISGTALVRHTDPMEAFYLAAERLRGDETVLLKASRGDALERWIELLGNRASKTGSR